MIYDIVILTDCRYENPEKTDWYIEQILLEDGLVQSALEKKGLKVIRKSWDAKDFDWTQSRYAIFRSTWDYFDRFGEFFSWFEKTRKVLEETPTQDLLRELKEKDPSTHKSIDHQNPRRIIRAIEVIRITDRPFSEQKAKWTNQVPANFFLLERADQDLRKRIESRAEKMFESGLVEETCSLRTELENNPSAQQALGYRQVIGHLKGEQDLPETVCLVKSRTWQYARRQKTWFRKIRGAIEVKAAEAELEKETAQRIIDLIE